MNMRIDKSGPLPKAPLLDANEGVRGTAKTNDVPADLEQEAQRIAEALANTVPQRTSLLSNLGVKPAGMSAVNLRAGLDKGGEIPMMAAAGSANDNEVPAPKTQDDHALAALRAAVMVKGEAAKAELSAWVKQIDARVDNKDSFSVLEHTAFAFLLRTEFFAGQDTPAAEKADLDTKARSTLDRALHASWKQHTGKPAPEGQALQKLPLKVLRKADRRAQTYHAASFFTIGDRKAQQAESKLLRGYVPTNGDIAVGTATILACALSSVACQVTAAAVISYAVLSLSESWEHNHIAHPRPGTFGGFIIRKVKENASWLEKRVHGALQFMKKNIEGTHRSHQVVHHGMTFRDAYTEMFSSPEMKAKVDKYLDRLDPKEAERIRDEVYGSTLGLKGLIKIMGSIAPQVAALIFAGIKFGAAPAAFVPILLLAAVYPFTMKSVHPLLHEDEHQAREAAGPAMKAVLNSRWAAWANRNHWLHHEGQVNYNLSFPGADAFLGTLLQPNLEDLFRMADDGVLHY